MVDTGILLESGTNELELLEFTVGGQHYGINVAKIKEIIPYQIPTPIPHTHSFIEGIFMPRYELITVVDLFKALGIEHDEKRPLSRDMYVITNFNKLNTAFHVESVIGIHRVFWTDVSKPDSTISSTDQGVATGIVKLKDKILVILDFEKIVTEINPETGLKISDVDNLSEQERIAYPILLAEDSPLLLRMLKDCLGRAGYHHLICTSDGHEAWEKLNQNATRYGREDKSNRVALVITDIEMPRMDGHHLLKRIKSDEQFEGVPVVIFSSLVNEEMRVKGESLGADAQLSKPEIGKLVTQLDLLLQ